MLRPLSFLRIFVFIQGISGYALASSWDPPTVLPEGMADALQEAAKLFAPAQQRVAPNLLSPQSCPFQGNSGEKSQANRCINPRPSSVRLQETPGNPNRLLIFVSLSMPETSLKGLAQEAAQGPFSPKYKTIFVLRGLYQDSFMKTAQKLQEMGLSADIHPELFEAHQITAVPTFVFLKEGAPAHSLKGNVTLGFAIQKIEGQTEAEGNKTEVPYGEAPHTGGNHDEK